MAEIRRRRTATRSTAKPVTRRRDRVNEEPDDDEEDEDVNVATARRSRKSTTTKRRPDPVDEEEDYDDDDEEEEEEDADDEEETPRRTKSKTSRRRPADDEDGEDDEEKTPQQPAKSSSRKATSKPKLPPGVYTGPDADEMVRGSGAAALKVDKTMRLIKFLEPATQKITFRQHWVAQGVGQGDRPYLCPGRGCPLCAMSNRTAAVYIFNVLQLSHTDEPANRILRVGVRAWKNLEELATSKTSGKVNITQGFWAINKTGSGNAVSTNFKPVKQRDLEEDWPEIFENFAFEDLDALVAEAKENVFGVRDVVEETPMKALRDIARHLADDDEEDEDEDD
jgi:hypothetical protein